MKSQKHYSKRQHSHSRSSRRSGSSSGGGGGNPLSRVYESNGPDVKVRGTAQTVADKYLQLGRDAHVSGDIVMAESYYQHAEHYLRIVAAAQAYSQQNQQNYRRPTDDELFDGEESEDSEETTAEDTPQGGSDRQPHVRPEQPDLQPEQVDAQGDGDQSQPYSKRDRNDQGRDRGERYSSSKSRWDRGRDRTRSDYQPREQRESRDYADPARQPQPRIEDTPREAAAEATEPAGWEAPSFLRRPSPSDANGEKRGRYERKPRRESAEAAEATEAPRATEDVPPAE